MLSEFSLFENFIFIAFVVILAFFILRKVYTKFINLGTKEFTTTIISKNLEISQNQSMYNQGPAIGVQSGLVENIEIKYFSFEIEGSSVCYEVSDEIFNKYEEHQKVNLIVKNGKLISINGECNEVKNKKLSFVSLNS